MQIELKSVGDIEALLVKLIKKGCEDYDAVVEPVTVPMKDLEGFDSLSALEVLTELEEESGLHFDDDVFYVHLTPRTHRSIREVAVAIWNEIDKGGKSNG